jgi:hypothetical protein
MTQGQAYTLGWLVHIWCNSSSKLKAAVKPRAFLKHSRLLRAQLGPSMRGLPTLIRYCCCHRSMCQT